MWSALKRFFGAAEGPAARLEAGPPAWVEAIADTLRKQARGQSKLDARVEAVEGELRDGLAALRTAVSQATRSSWRWDELFDAMDILDEAAARAGHEGQGGVASGLASVRERLERFAASAGMRRVAPLGEAPNDKRFRVVGVEPASGPEGVVVRVVRAAILDGERVLREGEVIVSGRAS